MWRGFLGKLKGRPPVCGQNSTAIDLPSCDATPSPVSQRAAMISHEQQRDLGPKCGISDAVRSSQGSVNGNVETVRLGRR